jgi:hypothetical protein
MKPRHILVGALLLMALALAACSGGGSAATEEAATACPTAEPCPECPEVQECPEAPAAAVENVPNEEAWAGSAHADAEAEAFNHWNEDGEIPTSCAKCHSTPGYLDFLGADGSEFGVVNAAAPTGTVITCEACHNSVTAKLTSVVFPSGAEITGLGDSARCMQCHQGRASTNTVLDALAETGTDVDQDTPNADLSFINIHYYAAAATLFGSQAHGGFEYEGMAYEPRFDHVENYDTCDKCHNPHTLELRIDECSACHTNVSSVEDLHDIRMNGSLSDFDGDGNIEEGLYYEVEGLREMLYQAIQAYADEVVGTPIVYNEASHPYFFIDTNGNGEADEDESVRDNAYNAFTGRLLKATYNYQASIKDPGAFAHNGKYIIQLLYDSIASLNEELSSPVDLATAHRDAPGHFDGSAEPFRHWDEEGLVSETCSKCHTAEGLPFYLEHGEFQAFEPSNGLACTTCHQSLEDFSLYEVTEVTFPSGATLGFENDTASNLCLNCHQGRESTVSVNNAIAASGATGNQVSDALSFRNVHYFAAGATLFGGEAQGGYQYDGKSYTGRFPHVGGFDSCQECHNVHSLQVRTEECQTCHGTTDPRTIRMPNGEPVDFDGDGDTSEGIAGEIETMQEALYAAIQEYASTTLNAPIAYNAAAYPYWFADTNENGEADADESQVPNQYASWTPNLLRAAYNYQYVTKDPGAFAHNSNYIMQLLYDSLESVGGSQAVSGMTRPPAE